MRQNDVRLTSIPAGLGKKGTFQLQPDPSHAVFKLNSFWNSCVDGLENACVIVLPYAPLPDDLVTELDTFVELGGHVEYPQAGTDGWPELQKRQKPDTAFLNTLHRKLCEALLDNDSTLPSEYFRTLSADCDTFIITEGALDLCDMVAPHRYPFLKNAADALLELVSIGTEGRVDDFFRQRGITHAQTGGITTTLEVTCPGEIIRCTPSNVHLKQGDHTTPQAAVRIYYQDFLYCGRNYIAVVYAGPHPSADINRRHTLI
ncbi:hypothetical protein IB234_05940 [Pseudomonas sp. PDM16]|uniref:hypothetical protein n=1 Tax=Pseudomonas sp. PDM16 TaxID=2769292 RepID=UPI00177D5F5E|nr:hypothetical protein [Pseudomonas sp. PDM16]MBD9414097.1 hypothetical protein [Pseudomonas sp. PDM16]